MKLKKHLNNILPFVNALILMITALYGNYLFISDNLYRQNNYCEKQRAISGFKTLAEIKGSILFWSIS